MKKKCLIFLLISILGLAQNNTKTYSYKSRFFSESITLNSDGTFKYLQDEEFISRKISGNWQIRNDSILVLDSNPQMLKLLVNFDIKKGSKKVIKVTDFDNRSFHYHLYLINNQGETITYRDQFDKTIVNQDFTSFFIISSAGVYSPKYDVRSENINFFDVKFQHLRIFENEYWKFYGDTIIPLGLDNKYVKYNLTLEDNRGN